MIQESERQLLVELAALTGDQICTFCSSEKVIDVPLGRCCEFLVWCLLGRDFHNDCEDFHPFRPLDMIIELVSAPLRQGWVNFDIKWYSDTECTMFGVDAEGKESKVRIGHNGKPTGS